jgi:isopentenyl phosphate kinase
MIELRILRYAHHVVACGRNVRGKVVVKWGGGLITEKEQLCTANREIIHNLVDTIITCHKNNLDVILVHGAGSFGHLRAKQWRLNEGKLDSSLFSADDTCSTQEQAVKLVRKDMLTLNSIVMEELTNADISAAVLPPHNWASGTGENFEGDLAFFASAPEGIVMVTYGDVVDCDEPMRFGILSGDDLVTRLAIEVPNVKRLVFAIGGVDGLLRCPPQRATADDLIEIWNPDIKFEGEHQQDIDVTGGIGLKAARGAKVAQKGIEVIMVSGQHPKRVADACIGVETRGTKVVSNL